MKGSIQSFVLEDKSCHVYLPPGEIAQKADTVYVLDGEDFAGRLEEMEPYLRLETCRPFRLVFFDPVDWNRDYSPWPAPAVFRRGEAFAGKAGQVLSFLRQRLIPEIQDRYPGEDSPKHRGLLGYSLGGLCALWMLYTSGVFRYAAACSPSVWYEGWQEFVKENTLSEESRLYLSLGNREEKTRNPHMARGGDVMSRSTAGIWESPSFVWSGTKADIFRTSPCVWQRGSSGFCSGRKRQENPSKTNIRVV